MDEPSQFSIRLPADIRQYLHSEANQNERSINHEIVKRLQHCVDVEKSALDHKESVYTVVMDEKKEYQSTDERFDALLAEIQSPNTPLSLIHISEPTRPY